jgi:hypothetical protein
MLVAQSTAHVCCPPIFSENSSTDRLGLSSGDADNAACQTQYNNCLDSFSVFQTAAVSQGIDCVSLFNDCHDNGIDDNTCNSYNAQCKDKCSVMYGTCLSSGSADSTACMAQYNNCFDSFTPSTSIDCVSNYTMCLDSGIASNTCASVSNHSIFVFYAPLRLWTIG